MSAPQSQGATRPPATGIPASGGSASGGSASGIPASGGSASGGSASGGPASSGRSASAQTGATLSRPAPREPASRPEGERAARPQPPRKAPTLRAATAALLRKELLLELRTFESAPGMILFAASTFIIFHFALNAAAVHGDLAAGMLWVTILFAAMLGINRLFVADAGEGGFDSLLLSPVDASAMLLAKVAALLIYLVALEVVALPLFVLLLLGPGLGGVLADLVGVIALADLGLAVIGTFVAALAVRTRARDLIGPLIALPLIVPIAIGAARATAPLLAASHASGVEAKWLLLLGLYDLVFGLIAYAVFDFLLED